MKMTAAGVMQGQDRGWKVGVIHLLWEDCATIEIAWQNGTGPKREMRNEESNAVGMRREGKATNEWIPLSQRTAWAEL
jgi:hypothetical protein